MRPVPRAMKDDDQLVSQYLRTGNTGAVKELLSSYEDRLFRYLWQMLRHREDCEDVLQETFRKAIKALPGYRKENHFKSWLFRIGHNCALDVIRRRKRVTTLDEGQEESLAATGKGPLEALAQREKIEALRHAVEELPPAEREVVSLRLQADLSFREIAECMGTPLGTVLARMHKAKERLRVRLS